MSQFIRLCFSLNVLLFLLINSSLMGQSFITTWKTDNPGSSNDNEITIPTTGGGYNYDVDWGDGMSDTGVTGNITHTYAIAGTYTVTISGAFPRIYFNSGGFFGDDTDSDKLLTIEQWGDIAWSSMAGAFSGCSNLRINASDSPDLSAVTDMTEMFYDAEVLDDNINNWDVSNVQIMNSMFRDATSFNQPLDLWVTDNVTDMRRMFSFASAFNQDIGGWNVSNVTDMSSMFGGATSFNQDISGWTVTSVLTMNQMFSVATSFNQNIGGWTMTSVTNIAGMFNGATVFNQDISGWDVSNVTSMITVFSNAPAFNQDISGWVVDNVNNMRAMFNGATAFNQDISGWNVANVGDMEDMFNGASAFNQDISGWNVANVGDMSGMFEGATSFDQDISGWNVSNVDDMRFMFSNATSFNVDLGGWVITDLRFAVNMFDNSGLSIENYDATLIGWSGQAVRSNVSLGAQNIFYCAAEGARENLITTFNWFISDGGQGCIAVYDGLDTAAPEIMNGQAAPIEFGSISVLPATKTRNITILNRILSDLTNVNIAITGTAFSIVPAAPTTITSGTSETINVVLSGNTPGVFLETVSITSDDFSGTFSFDLVGEITAVPEPEIVVYEGTSITGTEIIDDQPSTYDFGSVGRGNILAAEITLTNIGSASLDISNMSISGSAFSFASTTPASVAVGATETVQIILDGSVSGIFTETLTIINNDTNEATFNFDIEGEIVGPDIAVFQGANIFSSLDEIFDGQVASVDLGTGSQGTDIIQQITITNFSELELNVLDISITGSAFSINAITPFTILGEFDGDGDKVTWDLTLSGANPGTFNETIIITSDDDDEPTFEFPITGVISAAGTVRYVKWDATGNNDGTSWTDAFTDLQNALAVAINEDQIWIAEGIYKPDLSGPGNTSLTFNIISDRLRLYGGFLGTESQLSERIGDPTLTVLSGDLNGDDGAAFTNTSDNSENVLTVNGFIVFIDYLTISGGNAPSNGGGILANNAGVYLTNAVLENNQSNIFGGGVYLDGGSIQFYKTLIRNNEAGNWGGGAHIINAEPYFFRSIFESNEAFAGAGLYMSNANRVNNSTFYYNQFINNGRNQGVEGGAIQLFDSYYESFGDLFINNFAYDAGGAIYARDGSTILLTNSTFGNNSVNDASADIFFTSNDLLGIYNSILWGATSLSGATGSLVSINNYPASFEIRNSIVQAWDPSEYSIPPVATNVSDLDPLFTDAANDDFTLGNSSPAIDMGDNSYASYLDVEDEDRDMDFSEPAPYDLSGNSRYFNSTIDIGAYENQPAAVPEPEIAVFQSSAEIFDGQSGPVNFGTQVQGTGINQMLSIENQGNTDLTITDINISGTDFIINSAISFPIVIGVSGNQLLDILLSGSTVGTFTETVTIQSDDLDEGVFDFEITGEITTPLTPEIAVFLGSEILDGQAAAIDIGTVALGSSTSQTFIVNNTGSADLTVSGITISGSSFSSPTTTPFTIISGGSSTFDITLDAATAGNFTETVTITNNDADEGSFEFTITGEVTSTNNSPTISPIADTTIDEDGSTGNLPFTINDAETNLDDLIVTASSNNTALVTSTGIVLSGTGGDRIIIVTPESNVNGTVIIAVQVDDGQAVVSETFTLTVVPVNDAPLITGQSALSTLQNTPITLDLNNFTVTDIDNTYPDGFSLLINAGANFTVNGAEITPNPEFVGDLTVPVIINDGQDDSPIFNATVTVEAGQLSVDIEGAPLANGSIINFDDIPVGAEDSRELIITNTGSVALVITDIVISGDDFILNSALPDPILPSESSPLSISFRPSSIGPKTATVTISSQSAADFIATLNASGLSEAPPLEIFNVVTTQQNGKHDFLEIRNIEFYESNKVFIYNRWGNEVFKTANYNNTDNSFIGNTGSGDELPDGTYYYVIELNGGETVENGFFLLRR
jgi:gliding motility-associated-like protein